MHALPRVRGSRYCAAVSPTETVAVSTQPADGVRARRERLSWWSWDFGATALNSVMISFVFSVYVTNTVAGDKTLGQQTWSDAQTLTGVALALLAPMMGAWADRARSRRLMLSVATVLMVLLIAAGWFVKPHPDYLLLGVSLLALAAVVQEIGAVLYNGMLLQISTPANIGRTSAIGWGAGYLGGVLCLVIVLFGFVLNGGFLHLPAAELVNIRAIAVFAALFMAVFCLPIMLHGPNRPGEQSGERFNIARAYRDIFVRVLRMWRNERGLLHFLISSAVFRDGLTAVFSFGGVIAATSYGFSPTGVIFFGLAANVVALLGTWGLSGLDDRIGPKHVIMGSLVIMVVAGFFVTAIHSTVAFWICGLLISSQAGLVQSASRTLLARLAPEGEENETFGLYATTGRVASFIAPGLVALFTRFLGVDWGILGIVVTLALGLAILIPLRIPGITHGRR